MSTEDDLVRAHRAVKEVARTLEAQGVGPEDIVDALLVVGTNAALRMWGGDAALNYFKRVETTIKGGEPISGARH